MPTAITSTSDDTRECPQTPTPCSSSTRRPSPSSGAFVLTLLKYGRLTALTRLDVIGSCKCSVVGVAANQRSLFHCFRGHISLTATNITRPMLDH